MEKSMMDNFLIEETKPQECLDFYTHEIKSKRILIVDDDTDFRLVLSELLVGLGYSISTAKNGKDALRHLAVMEELPQLILLDSHMPEINGKEFLRMKAKMTELDHIPVVMISGDLMAAEEYQFEGVSSCLSKPLDMLEVIEVVEEKMTNA
jgi:CheY-like chemotaxis protein